MTASVTGRLHFPPDYLVASDCHIRQKNEKEARTLAHETRPVSPRNRPKIPPRWNISGCHSDGDVPRQRKASPCTSHKTQLQGDETVPCFDRSSHGSRSDTVRSTAVQSRSDQVSELQVSICSDGWDCSQLSRRVFYCRSWAGWKQVSRYKTWSAYSTNATMQFDWTSRISATMESRLTIQLCLVLGSEGMDDWCWGLGANPNKGVSSILPLSEPLFS